MRRAVRNPLAVLVLLVLSLLAVAGCGQAGFGGLYGAPLPGGADLGERPYRVTAQFADVLDLVPQAAVKVNDVPVGKVEQISLTPDNSRAVVTLAVNDGVRLPANAGARLRQSSLLGEKFVELAAPKGEPPRGSLRDGGVIPLERTNRSPQVEEVLGALSLLLNGGGLGQMRSIVTELNHAMSGNEAQIRSTLATVDATVTKLDAQKDDITRAIDGMNRLSATLAGQKDDIQGALDKLGPGLRELNDQRDELVRMLQSMDRLSGVAVDTMHRSRDDLVADLAALEPTLRKLAESGDKLPKALSFIMAYPFPDNAMNALKGDFMNADVRVDLDLSHLLGNWGRSSGPPVPIPGVNDSGQPKMPEGRESAGPPLPLPGQNGPAPALRPPQPPPQPPDESGERDSRSWLGGLFGGQG